MPEANHFFPGVAAEQTRGSGTPALFVQIGRFTAAKSDDPDKQVSVEDHSKQRLANRFGDQKLAGPEFLSGNIRSAADPIRDR